MADEPQATTGSVPEGLSVDAPHDVNWNALMARSQSQLITQTGREVQANEDLREKLAILKEYRA